MNYDIKVWQEDNRILTNSRNVAEVFDKRHDNVLRDIDELFNALKFEGVKKEDFFQESSYQDAKNETRKEYLLTKDGFTLLAMGFYLSSLSLARRAVITSSLSSSFSIFILRESISLCKLA